MLRITQLEEISNLLLALPELVERQQRPAAEFAAAVNSWLLALEGVFIALRMHQAGTVAVLRSVCLSADYGQIPQGLTFREPPTRSRLTQAVAAHALQQGSELASAVVASNQPRTSEAQRVAQQVAATAFSRNILAPQPEGNASEHYLRAIRRDLAAMEDLEVAMVHIEGLVGPTDALICLDRALEPYLGATKAGHRP